MADINFDNNNVSSPLINNTIGGNDKGFNNDAGSDVQVDESGLSSEEVKDANKIKITLIPQHYSLTLFISA